MGITPSKFETLLADECAADHREIVLNILQQYIPEAVLECCRKKGIKVRPLRRNETALQASPYLRGLDTTPTERVFLESLAAGMFVVPERTAYLKVHNPETVVHEFGHAFDLALGKGHSYFSNGHEVRLLYAQAGLGFRGFSNTGYVTDYASSRTDEFFAESFRAYLGVNHEDATPDHPRFATAEKLLALQPRMFSLMRRLVDGGTAEVFYKQELSERNCDARSS